MTSRVYDVILEVNSVTGFTSGNIVFGVTSATTATIANVDTVSSTLRVKLANIRQEFSVGESLLSNIAIISGTANGALNTTSLPFQANTLSSNTTSGSTSIVSITPSSYIAEKNAFTQNPVVRLYTIYYPGEWYPPNEYGNPSNAGEGRAWPGDFPIRFAEVIGDLSDDLLYNVAFGTTTFTPFPVQSSGLEQSSDGKVNEVTLTTFNVDNIISNLVENPYLVGNNISNSSIAYVNGQAVHGIDPRTINADPADVGTVGSDAYDSLTRARANGLAYSASIEAYYGSANATFDKTQTDYIGGIWQNQKIDSRDLLGAVVEIKTTFANFLDFWPEYSIISNVSSNVITVNNSIVYRVGDNVKSSKGSTEATIQLIDADTIHMSNAIDANTAIGDPLYIVNILADSSNYLQDNYKIDQLESLTEYVATFGLVSWLQYFKTVTPKRKYYKNTCQWKYKGEECQYPGFGSLPIPNSTLVSNTNPIAANNQIASSALGDVCAKSLKACELRNNSVHFGGFPGVGRSIPRS